MTRSGDFRLVESLPDLEQSCQALSEACRGSWYLDTEFESNRSGTSLCLIQVRAGEQIVLIDAIKLRELSPLAELLGKPDIEWVLHAGSQDVALLMNALRLPVPPQLFDTQIAWALLSPEASVSLAYLQFKLEGVRAAKAHQADDWVRRPLPASQLRYAASDVVYLPGMTEKLRARAEHKARLGVIRDASRDALNPTKDPPPPLRLASFRNAWQLGARSQAALLVLIEWYNQLSPAERQHAPDNKVLLSIASRLPLTLQDLSRIKGAGQGFVKRYGKQLLVDLERASANAETEGFTPIDPPSYATFEEIALDAWLTNLRAHLCIELECAPELVMPARLVKAMQGSVLVKGPSALTEPLQGWRKSLLEEPIAAYAAHTPPPEE